MTTMASKERSSNLTLAIQKGVGRLAKETRDFLTKSDLSFSFPDRSDYAEVGNFPLSLLQIRDDDIPEYVNRGLADFGIVGFDILEEIRAARNLDPFSFMRESGQLRPFKFAECELALGVRTDVPYERLEDLNGLTVATSYPNYARRFFTEAGIAVNLLPLTGSVELPLFLGNAEATVDVIQTGDTWKANGIIAVERLCKSCAMLISSPYLWRKTHLQKTVEELFIRLESTAMTESHSLLELNAPLSAKKRIIDILPTAQSPTVSPLDIPKWISIKSAIPKGEYWDTYNALIQLGAKDIIEQQMKRILPNSNDWLIHGMMISIFG